MSRFVTNNLQTTTNKENELSYIDTSKLHCVKVPANHIVIDFDHKVIDLTCALGEEVAHYIKNIEKDENGNSEAGIHILFETKRESGIDVGMVKRTIDLITSLDKYNARR